MFAIADHCVQPRPVARMPPEARGKARLLIMQAPSEARGARRAACFILQPSGELVRLGQGRGHQVLPTVGGGLRYTHHSVHQIESRHTALTKTHAEKLGGHMNLSVDQIHVMINHKAHKAHKEGTKKAQRLRFS